MQALRSVHKGQAYLASTVDVSKMIPKLEETKVVRDFSDVFLEDLCGIPPNRDVQFAIDLVLGTASISKAPYKNGTY